MSSEIVPKGPRSEDLSHFYVQKLSILGVSEDIWDSFSKQIWTRNKLNSVFLEQSFWNIAVIWETQRTLDFERLVWEYTLELF